ncbi:hypothetical protein VUR80DRAFT_2779 [Thermomyces stellatus]
MTRGTIMVQIFTSAPWGRIPFGSNTSTGLPPSSSPQASTWPSATSPPRPSPLPNIRPHLRGLSRELRSGYGSFVIRGLRVSGAHPRRQYRHLRRPSLARRASLWSLGHQDRREPRRRGPDVHYRPDRGQGRRRLDREPPACKKVFPHGVGGYRLALCAGDGARGGGT